MVFPSSKNLTKLALRDLRRKFIEELRRAPSLDENGYICTKDDAINAFDRALSR